MDPEAEPAGPAARPRLSRRRRLVFALTLAVLAIAALEVGVRALFPTANISPLWEYHPRLGWTQTRGRTFDVEVDGRPVRIEFNSLGFRDVEHQREKPSGTKRIVVIGDSFCEAVQVNLDETFWRRLGQALNARGPARWEVINLGVGDHGNAQALIALQDFGLGYEPDLVLHVLFPLNDIANNGLDLAFLAKSPNDRYRPYFVERDGELVLTSAQPLRNFLRRNLVSYGLLERAFFSVFPSPDVAADATREPMLKAAGFDGLDPLLYTFVPDEQQPPAIRRSWHITERIEAQIVATCRARGVGIATVVLPFEGLIGKNAEPFMQAQPPPKLVPDYAQRRLARLFERLGVPCLTMWDYFDAHPDRFLPCIDGHLNRTAHEATATELLRTLIEAGLVE